MPLTPLRRATPEFLDDPATDLAVVARSSEDIAACNRLFGGTRALLAELDAVWPALPREATLLDVGCGVGDLSAAARRAAQSRGITLRTVALDRRPELAARASGRGMSAVAARAEALPFPDRSADVVIACQFLHHFTDAALAPLVRELDRVARVCVIVSDLRRSWVAAGGMWLASWPLGFHPITRHDGCASVLKGFQPAELSRVLSAALGRPVGARARAGFRVTAHWTPGVTS